MFKEENTEETLTITPEEDTQQQVGTEQPKPESEVFDWATDKRYKTMWKGDANELYKSYRNMEKTYNPLKSQLDSMSAIYKKHGIDQEKLEDTLTEYKTYRDPESPNNKWLSYLGNWMQNDGAKGKVVEFFKSLEKEEKIKRFGKDLPDEVLDKLDRVEHLEKMIQEKEEHEQYQQKVSEASKQIDEQLTNIESLAKEYGVDYDEETKQRFLKYCASKEIEPKYMSAVFAQEALKAVHQSATIKSQRDTMSNVEKSRKSGIISSTPSSEGATELKSSFQDDMKKLLGF